jgi:quinol monooxygenase YgiN
MILITGSAIAKPEHLSEATRLSLEHVHRSRLEPGCLHHAVHTDLENPFKLVFVEKWADMAAVQAHFAVPASREFAKALYKIAVQPPVIELFDGHPAPLV